MENMSKKLILTIFLVSLLGCLPRFENSLDLRISKNSKLIGEWFLEDEKLNIEAGANGAYKFTNYVDGNGWIGDFRLYRHNNIRIIEVNYSSLSQFDLCPNDSGGEYICNIENMQFDGYGLYKIEISSSVIELEPFAYHEFAKKNGLPLAENCNFKNFTKRSASEESSSQGKFGCPVISAKKMEILKFISKNKSAFDAEGKIVISRP